MRGVSVGIVAWNAILCLVSWVRNYKDWQWRGKYTAVTSLHEKCHTAMNTGGGEGGKREERMGGQA